jgi:hypothetical protein
MNSASDAGSGESISDLLGKFGRKIWSEIVVGKSGRKIWSENLVGKSGRIIWSEHLVGKFGRKIWSENLVGKSDLTWICITYPDSAL